MHNLIPRRTTPSPACICLEGFSIIQATINLSRLVRSFKIGGLEISPSSLYENGLLIKLAITKVEQIKDICVPWRLKTLVYNVLYTRDRYFVVLELLPVPLTYHGYPCSSQHYIRINLVRYGLPRFEQWDTDRI